MHLYAIISVDTKIQLYQKRLQLMHLVEKMHWDCFQAKTSTTHKLYFLKPVKREIVFVMWIKIWRKNVNFDTTANFENMQIRKKCSITLLYTLLLYTIGNNNRLYFKTRLGFEYVSNVMSYAADVTCTNMTTSTCTMILICRQNTGLLNDNEIGENKFYHTLVYSNPWLDRKVYI